MVIALTAQMSCAHFYHQKQWDEHTNREVFGKCFDSHGHGHDYRLEVSYFCDTPSWSVFEAERKLKLKALVEELDHRHINHTVPEFKDKVPTTENLALYCLERIKKLDPTAQIRGLRLFETDDLWVELTV